MSLYKTATITAIFIFLMYLFFQFFFKLKINPSWIFFSFCDFAFLHCCWCLGILEFKLVSRCCKPFGQQASGIFFNFFFSLLQWLFQDNPVFCFLNPTVWYCWNTSLLVLFRIVCLISRAHWLRMSRLDEGVWFDSIWFFFFFLTLRYDSNPIDLAFGWLWFRVFF